MLEVFTYEIIPQINKRTKRADPYEFAIQPGPVALANNKYDVVVGVIALADAQLLADLWLFSKPFDGDVYKKWDWNNVPWYLGHVGLDATIERNGVAIHENNNLRIPIGSQSDSRAVHCYLTFGTLFPARISIKIAVEQAKRD